MTDKEKEQQSIEQLSPEKLHKQIQKDKRKAVRSTVFAVAALVALIAICIAWFVYNNMVKGTTGSISAKNDQPFLLASTGVRQEAEKTELADKLSAGIEAASYTEYIDVETGKKENFPTNTKLQTGTSGLAWYLSGQTSFAPGASGELEFYLIPQREGLSSAKISLMLSAYPDSDSTDKNKRLNQLLSGHILLFKHLDDEIGYSGWLGTDKTFTLTAPSTGNEAGKFQVGIPYKVTLYWKWPQYFRNYIYTQRSTQGDLFTDKVNDAEYEALNKFVNDQNKATESSLFFGTLDSNNGEGNITISKDDQGNVVKLDRNMSDGVLTAYTQYYNQADEYIGTNAKYIYVEMEVSE